MKTFAQALEYVRRKYPNENRQDVLAVTAMRMMEVRAKVAVHRALKSGKLIKPDRCEECGQAGLVESFHPSGYEHVFDVRWLCRKCRNKITRK